MIKKFQIVSDIHIEKNSKSIKDVIVPCAPYLIIAGDLGNVCDHVKYENTLREICQMFKKVVLVPGNHEYYTSNKNLTINVIDKFLKTLQDKLKNLYVLLNETVTIEDIVIYGSIFWSLCPSENVVPKNMYVKNEKGEPIPVTMEIYNKMHGYCVQDLKNALDFASVKEKKIIVVTHYAPTFQHTLSPKHAKNGISDPKNHMYCSNNEGLLNDNRVLVWIYGHTGFNGRCQKLITNQIDAENNMKDAVLRVDIAKLRIKN